MNPNPHPNPLLSRIAPLWPWACAALSGFLLALAFPGWNQGWLVWIALTPLVAAVWFSPRPARRAWLRNALLGYVAGYVFFSVTFSWLGSPLADLFKNSWLVCLPLLLALYLALFLAFWSWFIALLPRGNTTFLTSSRNIGIAFLAACAWTAQEWTRGWLFGGFGWNGLGIALHQNTALVQAADLAGVPGLTFLVAFANLIALITVRRFIAEVGRTRIRPHWDFSVMMASVVATFSYGVHALQHPVDPPGQSIIPLSIAAIQPDIRESEKWSAETAQHIYERYDALTALAFAHSPQLLIWPEAATLNDLNDQDTLHHLQDLVAHTNSAFIFGSFFSPAGDGEYNIAACLTDQGQTLQVYRKMHLVPFGEYIPLRHSFPLFAKIAGELVPGDLRPGNEFTVFHAAGLQIAPLICFEDTDADETRRFVGRGAQLLVNITNDSWFGHSPGSAQHLANATFRAIENRRPLVRAANTGITCIIDSEGRTVLDLRNSDGTPFLEGILCGTVSVPRDGPLTFYTRFGDWLPIGSAIIALISLIIPFAARFLSQSATRRGGGGGEPGLEGGRANRQSAISP